jgi:hypothetical protein
MALSHEVIAASGVDWSTATLDDAVPVAPVAPVVVAPLVVAVDALVEVPGVEEAALVAAAGGLTALLHPVTAMASATAATVKSFFTSTPSLAGATCLSAILPQRRHADAGAAHPGRGGRHRRQ